MEKREIHRRTVGQPRNVIERGTTYNTISVKLPFREYYVYPIFMNRLDSG